jgi:hypothetical protein
MVFSTSPDRKQETSVGPSSDESVRACRSSKGFTGCEVISPVLHSKKKNLPLSKVGVKEPLQGRFPLQKSSRRVRSVEEVDPTVTLKLVIGQDGARMRPVPLT